MPVLQEQKPVIDARRSAGVCSGVSSGVWIFLPLPSLAGVTRASLLLGDLFMIGRFVLMSAIPLYEMWILKRRLMAKTD